MSLRFLFLAPLLLIPLAQKPAAPANAGAWKIDAVHSTVLFKVKHLGTSWSIGRFNGVSGELTLDEAKPENTKLGVEIDAGSVDTNNKARDDHLRSEEFFSAKEFPKIAFTSTKVAKSGEKYTITGELALHGVKKSISFTAEKVGSSNIEVAGGPRIGFLAQTTIKRSDFGMDGHLDAVGDEVELTLAIELAH